MAKFVRWVQLHDVCVSLEESVVQSDSDHDPLDRQYNNRFKSLLWKILLITNHNHIEDKDGVDSGGSIQKLGG